MAAAFLTSSALVGVMLVSGWHRRRSSTHVVVNDAWLVRARTTRVPATPLWRQRISRWWLCRNASAYVYGEWQREFKVSQVILDRKTAATRPIVRVSNDFEISLAAPPRLLSNLRLQMQLTLVAMSALVTALTVGRQPQGATPPHDAYAPGGPSGVGVTPEVRGRWFMAGLATPSPHPFRTSTAMSTSGTTYPHSNVAGGGHTNVLVVPHANTITHTNAVTSHTNTDTRPLAGPF